MRGQVLKADSVEGLGLILGDDGVRYNFSQHRCGTTIGSSRGMLSISSVWVTRRAISICSRLPDNPLHSQFRRSPFVRGMRGLHPMRSPWQSRVTVSGRTFSDVCHPAISSSMAAHAAKSIGDTYCFRYLRSSWRLLSTRSLPYQYLASTTPRDTFSLSSPRFGYFIPSFRV